MEKSICDYVISKDIDFNCSDPVVGGAEAVGVIINRADIDFAQSTINQTQPNILEGIAFKKNTLRGFKIKQAVVNPFNGTNTALASGNVRNSWTKVLSFVVLDDGPEVSSKIIDPMANGEFVVIIEKKYKGLANANPGSSAFEVYGWHQGLKSSEISNDLYSEDTEGGWAVTLQETKAPMSKMYLYKTSYSATEALVESLTVAAAAASGS